MTRFRTGPGRGAGGAPKANAGDGRKSGIDAQAPAKDEDETAGTDPASAIDLEAAHERAS